MCRRKDPSKDRKALETYVTLRGYKQGRPEKEKKTNMDSLTLDEIAKELNTSKRNLQRALRIERNLTDKLLCVRRTTFVFIGVTIAYTFQKIY